ncbi:LacI family transcriptional regulator [Sinomonas atrocyanea]|uniref:LacI family transcriptional regulator n=1 Tax=Sinomonas atrocyanea TaxID=37927 RepID=A0A127A769_9MICC|nr:substrate-binding domain-containing protein [Sinomonas atrocyanea]AMM34634.1 LacI family transcriptional regulator [Sinomonas atrocyanea]GEB63112.1 LacI family transcriptional regulator [Sinomonas atrocyanea]GGG67327.1 LacI family transcriptional regulator [Sinomonas atrocyanea]
MENNTSERAVTLKDLARELGIHPSTVSRVLHSDPASARGAASEATAQRIRDLAAEVGYSPDPQATSLRTRRTRLLGVVVPRLSDLVLAIMYEGIEDAAARVGYSAFVTNSRDDEREQRRKVEMMLARRVDGLIIGDSHLDGDVLPDLRRRAVPFVLMNRRHPGFPSATCDDIRGGELVAEHLWDKGHQQVAVIAGEPYASTAVDRTSAFVERWRELGGDIAEDSIVWSRFDTQGGREAAEKILASGKAPTAVFAVNDFAAIGAMGALRAHGLTVGRDCAVVGYNDTSLAAELPIPLSSVRSPMAEIGRNAVRMLQGVLRGEDVESVRLEPALQVRESSA